MAKIFQIRWELDAVQRHHWESWDPVNGTSFTPANCMIDECALCSVLLCPHHDTLHLHHDGCPAEDLPHALTPDCSSRCRAANVRAANARGIAPETAGTDLFAEGHHG